MKRPRSYVGLTGFEGQDQVRALRNAVPVDRLMMVGCGMQGHPVQWAPDKWPNRCPPPWKQRHIFSSMPNVLNILHFTPLEGCDLFEHMCLAHHGAGPHFHGFQLNTVWPDIASLVRYKKRFPHAVVTIALQPESLDSVQWEPKEIARRLALYDDIVNYAILDPSAGRGQEINVAFTRRCYEAINRLMPNLGLVAAGGLHADNVEDKLSGLLREFPLSTDAEGKLRTPDDHLDVAKAIRYMHATDALLRKFEAQRQPQLVN